MAGERSALLVDGAGRRLAVHEVARPVERRPRRASKLAVGKAAVLDALVTAALAMKTVATHAIATSAVAVKAVATRAVAMGVSMTRTATSSAIFGAGSVGLEPTTFGSVDRCSIQLSYEPVAIVHTARPHTSAAGAGGEEGIRTPDRGLPSITV